MSPMRIDNTTKVGNVAGRPGVGRSASAQPFMVDEGNHASASQSAAPLASVTSLDALLALQAAPAVEDATERRRKLVRRGRSLLDTLDAMRADLLTGQLGEGRLTQLMAIIGQARDQADPELDAVLDDIELRARVELAKHGLYPA